MPESYEQRRRAMRLAQYKEFKNFLDANFQDITNAETVEQEQQARARVRAKMDELNRKYRRAFPPKQALSTTRTKTR